MYTVWMANRYCRTQSHQSDLQQCLHVQNTKSNLGVFHFHMVLLYQCLHFSVVMTKEAHWPKQKQKKTMPALTPTETILPSVLIVEGLTAWPGYKIVLADFDLFGCKVQVRVLQHACMCSVMCTGLYQNGIHFACWSPFSWSALYWPVGQWEFHKKASPKLEQAPFKLFSEASVRHCVNAVLGLENFEQQIILAGDWWSNFSQ